MKQIGLQASGRKVKFKIGESLVIAARGDDFDVLVWNEAIDQNTVEVSDPAYLVGCESDHRSEVAGPYRS